MFHNNQTDSGVASRDVGDVTSSFSPTFMSSSAIFSFNDSPSLEGQAMLLHTDQLEEAEPIDLGIE